MKRVLAAAVILNLIGAIFNALTADSVFGLIVTLGCLLIACSAYYNLWKSGF